MSEAFHIFAESQSLTLLLSIMMDQGEKNHYGFVPGFPGFLPCVLRRIYNFRRPGKSMMPWAANNDNAEDPF